MKIPLINTLPAPVSIISDIASASARLQASTWLEKPAAQAGGGEYGRRNSFAATNGGQRVVGSTGCDSLSYRDTANHHGSSVDFSLT